MQDKYCEYCGCEIKKQLSINYIKCHKCGGITQIYGKYQNEARKRQEGD